MNIYVGGLADSVTEEQLKSLFSQHGYVKSVKRIKDKFTGAMRDFAFVEMGTTDEGSQAISALNGVDVDGRRLRVNEARPREDRPQQRRPYGGGGHTGGGNRYSSSSRY